jgi:peptide/nickel transport system substrate-binding protein
MVQRPAWLTRAAMMMVAAMIFVACAGPAATPSPAGPSAPPTNPPSSGPTPTGAGTPGPTDGGPTDAPVLTPYPDPIEQPSDPSSIADSYPNYGAVDCAAHTFNGLPYAGGIQSITAPDPATVVFTLCNPDVAFLSKIAFSVFAINDKDYLIEHAAAGDLADSMNGTGPYVLDEWTRGSEIVYSAFDGYWGEAAATQNAVLRWLEAPNSRLGELRAGTAHGMTLVGPDDFESVANDPSLELLDSGGLNTLYLGMNHNYEPWNNPEVRQALAVGLNRQQFVDNFLPPGSEVASHFTPCSIPFACEGEAWPEMDIEGARAKITEIFGEAGLTTTLAYRDVARGYIPEPVPTATEIQAQLEAINIHATLDEQESGTFIGNSNAGLLDGLFLLGWGADYPDVTNFLDFHFGEGCTSAFGDCYPEIFENLNAGSTTADDAARAAAYEAANNAIREQVPMVPISHAGFANAYVAGVEGAQVSPLSNERLSFMAPPDGGDTIVFVQNAEPIGLYCADETDGESLRACEQSMESLYGFVVNDTAVEPALATECTPNEDLSVWTCALRQGVAFHGGQTFEAEDVIASFAAQWDAASPLHVGNTGNFEYWPGLWGGFLNPPAPCGIPEQPACE